MAKGYNPLTNTISSASSNYDEHKMVLKKETPEIAAGNTKNVGTIKLTDDSLRQRSQKFIDKFLKMRLYSKSSDQEERKSSDDYNSTSEEKENSAVNRTPSMNHQSALTSLIDSIPISRKEVKLKGILKNSTKNDSCPDLITVPSDHYGTNLQRSASAIESSSITNGKGNNNDFLSLDNNHNSQSLTLNSSKPIKRVRFNDKVFKTRYEPQQQVFNVGKLSYLQQRKMKKLGRKDSLNLDSPYTTEANLNKEKFMYSPQLQRLNSWPSNENKSDEDD